MTELGLERHASAGQRMTDGPADVELPASGAPTLHRHARRELARQRPDRAPQLGHVGGRAQEAEILGQGRDGVGRDLLRPVVLRDAPPGLRERHSPKLTHPPLDLL
jgi:hypothetical protein